MVSFAFGDKLSLFISVLAYIFDLAGGLDCARLWYAHPLQPKAMDRPA